MPYTYAHKMCSATATVVLVRNLPHRFSLDFTNTEVLIGRRAPMADAYPGHWCIPGGFLNVDEETIEQTAIREVLEETGATIKEEDLRLFHVASGPKTDPRAHVINVCYWIHASAVGQAADDLTELKWVTLGEALLIVTAFDHADILTKLLHHFESEAG